MTMQKCNGCIKVCVDLAFELNEERLGTSIATRSCFICGRFWKLTRAEKAE